MSLSDECTAFLNVLVVKCLTFGERKTAACAVERRMRRVQSERRERMAGGGESGWLEWVKTELCGPARACSKRCSERSRAKGRRERTAPPQPFTTPPQSLKRG